jgi:ankyrin repeat protein
MYNSNLSIHDNVSLYNNLSICNNELLMKLQLHHEHKTNHLKEFSNEINYFNSCKFDQDILNYELWCACNIENIELVELLLSLGADIESKNCIDNMTVLMFAVKRGLFRITKYLINHNANINAMDDTSDSVLHHACQGGYTEIIQLLLNSGADINAVNENNKNAFYYLSPEKENVILCELFREEAIFYSFISQLLQCEFLILDLN